MHRASGAYGGIGGTGCDSWNNVDAVHRTALRPALRHQASMTLCCVTVTVLVTVLRFPPVTAAAAAATVHVRQWRQRW
jgi:hypothetical protein